MTGVPAGSRPKDTDPPTTGSSGQICGPPPARLGVPAYFHPAIAATDWETLIRVARAAPAAPIVVLNAASGPGRARDPDLAAVAGRLAVAGARVLGYVDTGYGARRAVRVLRDVHRYRSWYGLSGVYLDRASAAKSDLPVYGAISVAARRAGMTLTALGHGVYPDPAYTALADLIVAFEGPWTAYRRLRVPAWAARMPPATFWHLVYDTPPQDLSEAAGLASRRNAGVIYVTDRAGVNPWDGLPSYFEQLADLAATGPAGDKAGDRGTDGEGGTGGESGTDGESGTR